MLSVSISRPMTLQFRHHSGSTIVYRIIAVLLYSLKHHCCHKFATDFLHTRCQKKTNYGHKSKADNIKCWRTCKTSLKD